MERERNEWGYYFPVGKKYYLPAEQANWRNTIKQLPVHTWYLGAANPKDLRVLK